MGKTTPTTLFVDWVNKRGVTQTATDLNVSESTVRTWLRGHGSPLGKNIWEMLRMAENEGVKLSFQMIYEESTRQLQ